MNHKWKRSLAVLLLAAAVTLSMPAVRAAAAELDLEKEIELAVNLGPTTAEQEFQDDLATANVQIDLYKIADAVREEGSKDVTYVFALVDGLTLSNTLDSYEKLSELENADWQALAQEAADKVLNGGAVSVTQTLTAAAEGDYQYSGTVDSGLYLVIAHGSDLEKDDYLLSEDGVITTIANSHNYVYTYGPELIALPSTVAEITGEVGEDGSRQEITTAGGDWQYDITATLKPTRDFRLGDLVIEKTVEKYEDSSPVTFTYRVIGVDDKGGTVYDQYVSITWPTSSTVTIADIFPVGTKVTVTEEDAGAGYKAVGPTTVETEILPPVDANGEEQVTFVNFTNTYDDKNVSGFGIMNVFTYDEDGGWTFQQDPPVIGEPIPTAK